MDQVNFAGSLYELRSELRDAARSLESFRCKLVGSRPEDSAKGTPQPATTVASLITDCRALACQINKSVAEHHQMVGDAPDVNPSQLGGSAINRAYA